jgi:hypothetical protein
MGKDAGGAVGAGYRRLRSFKACREGKSPMAMAWAAYKRGEISLDQLNARRDHISRMATCSTRWGDDVWEAGVVYPPGGPNRTGMVMCRTCFRYIPPQAMGSEGICYECWTEGMRLTAMIFLPSSSSVVKWSQM